ncbi:MAG: glycosyltransferase [Solirubrobacteraceae bacterium]|nr:glycosyltransferase [Solirubrobacteraceae bacterium]MDP4673295.1 glycosyltransferase [Solirubrobacteraceae bacterium]MDP4920925.1 glycosyltransferase [Solirubrobacteraceae bacterium]
MAEVDLSYCVVNTQQRELLLRALDAIGREQSALKITTEVLVLDNSSTDGSAGAARDHPVVDDLVVLEQRAGKAENDSMLLERASGRYALLCNEDTELQPGATQALYAALEENPLAAAAGAKLLNPEGQAQPSAWRFPGPLTALASALFVHHWTTVQSTGEITKPVDWAQSAALLVRREAGSQIGWLDPQFFVYSDEVDFCKRLSDEGWETLYVPSARAIHHEQLSTGALPEKRIVELSRNRDRYMRKHHSRISAALVRWLTAWTYSLRAIAATFLPGHNAARYRAHARASLHPDRGEGLREAALDYNRGGRRL